MTTLHFVLIAINYSATVFGMGEYYCGDYDKTPEPCTNGAITASGEVFNPDELVAAVPMPRNRILRVAEIKIRAHNGECLTIRVNDKKHERFIGNSGLDLSPATVEAITGTPATKHWSGRVSICAM